MRAARTAVVGMGLVMLVVAPAAAAGTNSSHAAPSRCTTADSKARVVLYGQVGGARAERICGPASVLVKVGGKRYPIKGGQCRKGFTLFSLLAGLVVRSPGKPQGRYVTFAMRVRPGPAKSYTALMYVQVPGKELKGTAKITFRQKPKTGVFAMTTGRTKVSGSFNCGA